MKNLLRLALANWILTQDQKTLLNASRETLLRSMLSPEQWQIVAALDKPDRWMPDPIITPTEAQQWGSLLASPLMLKLDVAMINWTQQQAQTAIGAPASEMIAAGKFALGCRAGWQMAKTLSRLAAAEGSEPEDDASPAASRLD